MCNPCQAIYNKCKSWLLVLYKTKQLNAIYYCWYAFFIPLEFGSNCIHLYPTSLFYCVVLVIIIKA